MSDVDIILYILDRIVFEEVMFIQKVDGLHVSFSFNGRYELKQVITPDAVLVDQVGE